MQHWMEWHQHRTELKFDAQRAAGMVSNPLTIGYPKPDSPAEGRGVSPP